MTAAQRIPGTYTAGRGSRTEPPDHIAVERACKGELMPLNLAEREAAVHYCLTVLRLSHRQTARRLHMTDRTVQRIKNRMRERSAA